MIASITMCIRSVWGNLKGKKGAQATGQKRKTTGLPASLWGLGPESSTSCTHTTSRGFLHIQSLPLYTATIITF